jgi:5'-AMP-activated protein kinase regulatory beta subunit
MGNQQVNGTGGGNVSSPRGRSNGGGGYGNQQRGGAYGAGGGGGGSSKPPPGGAAPVGYMQSHQQQYPNSAAAGGSTVKRSPSDQSMTDMAAGHGSSHGGGSGGGTSSQQQYMGDAPIPLDLATISAAEEDSVPTVFRWEHGGRNVYITGTFNGWSRQIPMHRSGNDFTYIHNLKRGKHAFKFIVDDEWRFAPDQPTVADIEGRINNFIDVTDFKAYTGDKEFEAERHADHCSRAAAAAASTASSGTSDQDETSSAGSNKAGRKNDKGAAGADMDGEVYGHSMPDLDEYTKEPPPLPPHLRHIILNKPPQLQDTAALPVPQHVALNHLYCTAIKDNMMVLGITQRYKTKSCTTVYYSPC